MLAEFGMAALWIAASLALLQFALGAAALQRQRPDLAGAVAPLAVAQATLCGVAFVTLIALFLRSDMSVLLVATNSHSAKPWLYKFAGTWGNHEGSMLLWVAILGVAGATVALFERSLRADTKIATLTVQASIALGFYAFLLFASNPFARVHGVVDGQGLNPLLQDPGLAFHPPTLYIGYVGMSAAFSFAIGALITRDVTPQFARAMRPWILGAWIFLTIGITAGSYWAYYELGWGGWWFWDPVENASLMPWLAATALLHSVTVLATRDALRTWTIMLSCVAFSMSMVGTFLVRSGILTSVHSFAVDPKRGIFILSLLAIYICGALIIFAMRVGTVAEGKRFDVVSREGVLVINNLLLSVILVVVMVGTLYPLGLEAFTGQKISVGAPFFNATTGPLALTLVAAMAAGPLLRWRRDEAAVLARRLALPIVVSIAALGVLLIATDDVPVLPLLGLVFAAGVGLASVAPLWKRNLARTPLFTWGMVLAHLGCAVSITGMAADSAFTKESLVPMKVGDVRPVGPFRLMFEDIQQVPGPNYDALQVTMRAELPNGDLVTLKPALHRFSNPAMVTNEAAIRTFWNGQLYVVVGDERAGGQWVMRMWWKPFVTLIWAGGIMIAFGGALSLVGRVHRSRTARKTTVRAAS
ncbi:heme lyase CcmF/NrfE family subunit [Chakrabartia godavariana]|nr:heme lyase CcmF/NrfE family subunit [Chakrabartia godavariana]